MKQGCSFVSAGILCWNNLIENYHKNLFFYKTLQIPGSSTIRKKKKIKNWDKSSRLLSEHPQTLGESQQ